MHRLDFESSSIDTIQKGFRNLVLKPLLGLYPLDFLKPYQVEIKYSPLELPMYRFQGDIIGLYVLFYGAKIVKLGTSSISSILPRMYTQAPIYGLVYSVFVVKRKLKIDKEDLDKQLYDHIKKIAGRSWNRLPQIQVRKPSTSKIVKAWLSCNNAALEKIVEVMSKLTALLSKFADSLMDFERIMGYGDYWFTPYYDEQLMEYVRKLPPTTDSLDELEKYCRKESCKGVLTILPNGLCILETMLNGGQKIFVTTCDQVSHKLLISLQ